MKASVEAPSNIAFVKYWGARDLERAIPNAPSISMTLRSCRSLCTAEFHDGEGGADEVWLVGRGRDAPPTRRQVHRARLPSSRVSCARCRAGAAGS